MAGIAKYERELRARIKDSGQWPAFSSGAFLNRLDSIASRAMLKGTTEGCLATILIYHQLVEEMVRLLIRDAQFLIQLGSFHHLYRVPREAEAGVWSAPAGAEGLSRF